MLQVLPPDIVKLSSLKVLSIPKNQVSELPLCLADMPSLSVVKLEGNPLIFPPPEVLQVQASTVQNEGVLKDSELSEVTVTAHIKRYLKQRANSINGRSDRADSPADDTAEGIETPRPAIKRVFSGRFPVKVNGNDLPDLRSPAGTRAPPIPSRSHYRGLSQQSTGQRRPGVMPLTIGNPNERVRSNSETIVRASSRERSESRSRRMGIVSKRSELSTLDETEANNRFSHYRGLSHGSAMQGPGNGPNMAVKSPNQGSPGDSALQRPVYVRRLSILPERRRESKIFDPVLEAAKGILYSIFQIHPMIQMLMSLSNDGTARRSSLEIVFYNTNLHVEQLELEIQRYEGAGGDGPRENENVQRACITLVQAYAHVCSLLISNVELFLDNGDPRYIRTLLTQLYNSIMELRVTCSQTRSSDNRIRNNHFAGPDLGATLKPHSRDNSVTPTVDRPLMSGRSRNGTFIHTPSSLRVATDVPVPYANGPSRNVVISAATPRSGESFTSTSTSALRGLTTGDFTEEDRAFEKIFLSLQKSSDLVMHILPTLNTQFTAAMRTAAGQRASDHVIQSWGALIAKCSMSIQQTETLKERLSSIKLKEPGVRTQGSFWSLCSTFIDSWYVLVKKIMHLQNDVQLPIDTKIRLRPIQQSMKETTELMLTSPWGFLARQYSMGGGGGGGDGASGPVGSRNNGHHNNHLSTSSNNTVPMPMTPQSAALGPAVQATVPSTPQSASFAAAFTGNVFERADALISMGGLSMHLGSHGGGYHSHANSRSGTMNSNSTASLNSINSSSTGTLSSQEGTTGVLTPASALSPVGPGTGSNGGGSFSGAPLPFRLNGGSSVGKVGGVSGF